MSVVPAFLKNLRASRMAEPMDRLSYIASRATAIAAGRPVESAYPVTAEQAAASDLPTRTEPAHREAYVTIPKSLVRYPDILSAFDAVEAWINENGEKFDGSPREVYFADFMEAGDDDLVCDIAFPIS